VSQVLRIVASVGRTGVVTPVALLRPVNIGGVTVGRANLHNREDVERKDIREGDTVRVERAGDVIPQVVERVEVAGAEARGAPFRMPERCPSCGAARRTAAPTRSARTPSAARRRPWRGSSTSAAASALDIEGLGEVTARLLVERGHGARCPTCSTCAPPTSSGSRASPPSRRPTSRRTSAQAPRTTLPRFLVALGIPEVGPPVARTLASASAPSRRCAPPTPPRSRPSAASARSWPRRSPASSPTRNAAVLDALLDGRVEVAPFEVVAPASDALAGATVVFTGALARFTRGAAEALVARSAARRRAACRGAPPWWSPGADAGSKLERAVALGVPVVDEEGFLAFLAERGVDAGRAAGPEPGGARASAPGRRSRERAFSNAVVAARLERLADLLEIDGANPFRVRAYRRPPPRSPPTRTASVRPGRRGDDLTDLKGVGKDLAAAIAALFETGEIPALAELAARVPPGLLDVVQVPGVGPKRAATLWRSSASPPRRPRAAAARAGWPRCPASARRPRRRCWPAWRRCAGTAGAGAWATPTRRCARCSGAAGCRGRATRRGAGSLRRGRATVGDVDLLAVADDPAPRDGGAARPSGRRRGARQRRHQDQRAARGRPAGRPAGGARGSVRRRVAVLHRAPRPTTSRCASAPSTAACGSPSTACSAAARTRRRRRRPARGERVAGADEAGVYAALGLAWIPPELREDRGEIAGRGRGRLPRCSTLDDVRATCTCTRPGRTASATCARCAPPAPPAATPTTRSPTTRRRCA
jgi:hypothetical protein